ncbi:MAG: hypothetical protein WC551_09665 [Patescibacteria group bacterium]
MAKIGDVKRVTSVFPAAMPRRGMPIHFPELRRGGNNSRDDEISPDQMLLDMERADLTAAKLEELRSRVEMKIAEARQKSHEAKQKLAAAGDPKTVKPKRYSIVAGQVVEDPEGEYTWTQAMQYLSVQLAGSQGDGQDKTLELLNTLAEYESRTGKGSRELTERELELKKELEEAKQETKRLEKELNTANLTAFKTEVMQAIAEIKKTNPNGDPKPWTDQISGFLSQYSTMDDKDPVKGILSRMISGLLGGSRDESRITVASYTDAEGRTFPGVSLSPDQFLQHEKILFDERKSIREAANREKMFQSIEKFASELGGGSVGDAIKDAAARKKSGDSSAQPTRQQVVNKSEDLARCPKCDSPLGITREGLLKCLGDKCGETYNPSAGEASNPEGVKSGDI